MAEGGEKRPSGSGDDEKKYPPEERPNGSGDDDKKKRKYPVGFRFKPTPDELVKHYLVPRLLGNKKPTVTNDHIIEANAYESDPEILTEKYKERGEDGVWYFLSPRFRKYAGGDRPGRRTDDRRGRWKQSSGQSSKLEVDAASTSHSKAKKKELCVGGTPAFTETTLAYHLGSPKAKNETRSKWLMLELVAVPTPENGLIGSKGAADPSHHNLLDKYVMCKIYKSPMKKWREDEQGSASASTCSASTCEEEVALAVSASSQSSWPSAGSIGETAAPTPPSSGQAAGKRPAVEKPSGHANAPNKRVFRATLALGGSSSALMRPPPAAMYNSVQGPVQRQPPPLATMCSRMQGPVRRRQLGGSSAPAHGIVGGGGVSVPIGLRLGAAGYHEYDSLRPAAAAEMYDSMRVPVHLQQRPPTPAAMYNSMRGQMQLQQHPSFLYGCNNNRTVVAPNGQAPAQRPPMVRLVPPPAPPRAAATGPNPLGGAGATMMMRPPPNLAAGQPPVGPPSFPRPPRQQQLQPVMEEDAQAHQERVFAQLLAAIKLQKEQQGSASCAGQQQTAPPTACFDEGVSDAAAADANDMVPHAQFQAPHNCSTCTGVQQQQPTPAVGTSAADDKRLSVPRGANEGSGNGDC